jgi:hypothetical protein
MCITACASLHVLHEPHTCNWSASAPPAEVPHTGSWLAGCLLTSPCLLRTLRVQPNATEHFKTVKVAYEVLSDPQQRAAYNRQRLQVGR